MCLFADDSSLFTCVRGVDETHRKLERDLKQVESWGYQWKMIFNPNLSKQAIEVVFSCKDKKPFHPELSFNGIPVARQSYTKHLGLYLDNRLSFSKHIKEKVGKAIKGLNLLKFLTRYVDRNTLAMSYKLYVRPHLEYGDVIFHNQRLDLMNIIEQVQYKAALIVSGCWQGTSREKLYQELGWESLSDRRWIRRLTIFYKIKKGLAPHYLLDHIPERNEISMSLRNRHNIPPFSRTDRYRNSFFPYTMNEWRGLSQEIKDKTSVKAFKESLYKFRRPVGPSLFGINDRWGIRLLTKIRVDFSDLRDHRFNHNFNCLSPICSCGTESETSSHFFLRCPLYDAQRVTLLSKISNTIHGDVAVLPNDHLLHIILYGSNVYNLATNKLILTESIMFIRHSGRFTHLEAFQ